MKLDGEKPVKVPLAHFDPPEEGTRPRKVSAQAWEDATAQAAFDIVGESTFLTSQFTNTDKLADPASARQTGTASTGSSKTRNGASKSAKTAQAAPTETRKPRRRRSTKVSADGVAQSVATEESNNGRTQRPTTDSNGQKKQGQRKSGSSNNGNKKGSNNRAGSDNGASQDRKQGAIKKGQNASSQTSAKQQPAKQGPRPGQRSSGLRQQANAAAGKTSSNGEGGQRRTRRRSHKSGGTGADPQGSAPKEG